ncbi:DUF192 domain-containing protein [Neobacillus vireti]|uniref:DUF192 domain-containing protein n=1 Tax=Neobacillus vireti TaxID=220686 RepID=UPI00300030B9
MLRLVNLGTGQVIAESIEPAETFFKRFKGLMFRKNLSPNSGLYLRPCNSIHTFFMKFPIDVLYINDHGKIVGIEEQLEPGKIGKRFPGAAAVIELPINSIKAFEITEGQLIKLSET